MPKVKHINCEVGDIIAFVTDLSTKEKEHLLILKKIIYKKDTYYTCLLLETGAIEDIHSRYFSPGNNISNVL